MEHKEFYQQARRTENTDFAGIRERSNNRYTCIEEKISMSNTIGCIKGLDDLKKYKYYGKGKGFEALHNHTALGIRHNRSGTTHQDTDDFLRLEHAIYGLVTEAGELLEAIYKHKYLGQPLDWVNIGEEVGDSQWYNAIMDEILPKYTGGDVLFWMAKVLDKLKERYPEKFTERDAAERNLESERQILEGPQDEFNFETT